MSGYTLITRGVWQDTNQANYFGREMQGDET